MGYYNPNKINYQEKAMENSLRIERALKHAEEIYQETGDVLKEKDFNDVFLAEEILEDMSYVRGMKEKYEESDEYKEKEAKKMATIFEVIMFDQIEQSEWLGEEAITKRASEFDDIKNGVDIIVRFPESKVNLAVDITFAKETSGKAAQIRRGIENNRLSTIKYFDPEKKGEKRNVPKVLIGMDYQKIDDLMELWMSKDNKALANSPVQFLILDQILEQLENYKKYAEKLGRGYVVKKYEELISVLDKVDEDKQELRNKVMLKEASKIEVDQVDEDIRRQSGFRPSF